METLIKEKTNICLKTIGEKLHELRVNNNYTQFDIACILNCDKSIISALERGAYKNITIKTLLKFCVVFNVDLKYFLI